MTLKGKVAVVTGGGRGIGKAVAKRFLAEGCRVLVAEVDAGAGLEAERELREAGEVRFVPVDVACERSVVLLAGAAKAHFGGVDLLVNNAGVMLRQPLETLDLKEWNRVLATNLTGGFLCVREFAPLLRQAQGAVINIASTRALMSEPDTESYAAAKGGLVALTHALAVSLGPAVRVNAISPGWIDVSAWGRAGLAGQEELSEVDHRQHPAGRVGRPEDVAALAVYLASPESGFVTGQNFVVDGGMTRKMIYAP